MHRTIVLQISSPFKRFRKPRAGGLTATFAHDYSRRALIPAEQQRGSIGKSTTESSADQMVREFQYRGETFRVNAHGIAGHEEVFIIYLVDGEEVEETSIDRMTEENDTSAPLKIFASCCAIA